MSESGNAIKGKEKCEEDGECTWRGRGVGHTLGRFSLSLITETPARLPVLVLVEYLSAGCRSGWQSYWSTQLDKRTLAN